MRVPPADCAAAAAGGRESFDLYFWNSFINSP